MINEEKVKLMTKMASYEAGEGKKYLAVCKYFRSARNVLCTEKPDYQDTAEIIRIKTYCSNSDRAYSEKIRFAEKTITGY